MTDADLQSLLTFWQKTLRLQDWQIITRFCDSTELHIPSDYGNCRIRAQQKSAVILIRRQGVGEDPFPFTEEEALVHELLHLHFEPFEVQTEPGHTAEEQAINLIAGALVELKRQPIPVEPLAQIDEVSWRSSLQPTGVLYAPIEKQGRP